MSGHLVEDRLLGQESRQHVTQRAQQPFGAHVAEALEQLRVLLTPMCDGAQLTPAPKARTDHASGRENAAEQPMLPF